MQPYLEELKGIQTVIQVQGADLAYQPDRYARTLAGVIAEFKLDVFCGIFSAQGKDLFPRLAAKAKAGLVSDCLAVDLDNRRAVKPVYSGKLLAEYQVEGEKALFTVRPNVIAVEARRRRRRRRSRAWRWTAATCGRGSSRSSRARRKRST